MSLSSLPTELVRQIVESSIPSTYHSTTYKERQAFLRSLCLVSRRFQHLAQPRLAEVICEDSLEDLDDTLDVLERQHHYGHLRQIAVVRGADTRSASTYLRRLAASAPSVNLLSADLSTELKLDLGAFERFHKLRSLQLACNGIESSAPIVLPNLEALALQGRVTPGITALLQPTALPSLRFLAFGSSQVNGSSIAEAAVNLIPQLHALFLDVLEYAHERLASAIDRTLFDIKVQNLGNVRNWLRIVQHLQVPQPLEARLLSLLASHIQDQSTISLKSLYLDSSFEHAMESNQDNSAAISSLRRICGQKGIVIVYEGQKKLWIDPWISEEFCRRQKSVKQTS